MTDKIEKLEKIVPEGWSGSDKSIFASASDMISICNTLVEKMNEIIEKLNSLDKE